eukprot:6184359-Pleurochrysis_carterae.AAC.2
MSSASKPRAAHPTCRGDMAGRSCLLLLKRILHNMGASRPKLLLTHTCTVNPSTCAPPPTSPPPSQSVGGITRALCPEGRQRMQRTSSSEQWLVGAADARIAQVAPCRPNISIRHPLQFVLTLLALQRVAAQTCEDGGRIEHSQTLG